MGGNSNGITPKISEHVAVSNYTDLNNGNNLTLAQYGVSKKVNDKLNVTIDFGVGSNYTKEKDFFLNIDAKASYKLNDNFSVGFRSRNFGGNDFAQSANRFSITGSVPLSDNVDLYVTGANTTKFASGKPTNYNSVFGGVEYNNGNSTLFAEADKTINGNLSFNVGYKYTF